MNSNLAEKLPNETPVFTSTITSKKPFLRSIIVIVVLAFAVFSAWGIKSLANMPRERAELKFNYFQRVIHGAEMAWTMFTLYLRAAPDPGAATKLPTVNIEISSEARHALNAQLPSSGLLPQSAKVAINGTEYDATVRYNGVSVNHWGMPHKSWNVKLKGGAYKGMSNFNLVIPRADIQFENWLGYEMAKIMGHLLAPDSEFIHFRLNGKFNGIRVLTEAYTPDMIKRRNLPVGKIFSGDVTTEEIYSGATRDRLFAEIKGWEVNSPFPNDQGTAELQPLIDLVQKFRNPYDFYYNIHEIMDVRALTQYMALLEIVSSVHIDETHNWKLYFNPELKQFAPIAFNTVAYYWKNNKGIDLAPNNLFRVMLSNPGLREQKDRELWAAINGSLSEQALTKLITDELNIVRPDMYAYAWKMHAGDRGIRLLSNKQWDDSIDDLLKIIKERHALIRDELAKTKASYVLVPGADRELAGQLAIKVDSRAGIRLEKIRLKLNSNASGVAVVLEPRGLEDLKKPLKTEATISTVSKNGVLEFSVNKLLSSKRRMPMRGNPEIVPSVYVFNFKTSDTNAKLAEVLELVATNSISGEKYSPTLNAKIEIPAKHTPNIVWWEPSEFIAE